MSLPFIKGEPSVRNSIVKRRKDLKPGNKMRRCEGEMYCEIPGDYSNVEGLEDSG
jgi:hypothetical protein